MPEKEVIMTEIMRKESNLNTMEGRSFTELQTMPATKDNLLEFRGRKYVIGQGRMGKQETKTENENYYLLTLAAIAKELRKRTGAKVVKVNLAVGVPFTLYGKEKKESKNYLRANALDYLFWYPQRRKNCSGRLFQKEIIILTGYSGIVMSLGM